MSKLISAMLDQPEHLVARAINKLEDKNGYPSHDARLIAENIQKVRTKIAQLGLDPDDTTGQEFYHGLLVKFEKDAAQFDVQFSRALDNYDQKTRTATEMVAKNIELPKRWALKSTAAKSLIRQNPPKHVMKRLHYRSVSSLIKREIPAEIFLAAQSLESVTWKKAHHKLVSALDSTAFELRELRLCSLTFSKWGELSDEPATAYDNDCGALAVLPSPSLSGTPLLSMAVMMLDSLANFKDINISKEASRLSPILAWWEDTDSLIAGLNAEHISLNLKDVSANQVAAKTFEQRDMAGSRHSFWQELLSRYTNQLQIEEDQVLNLGREMVSFSMPLNQPAFEYVEDI